MSNRKSSALNVMPGIKQPSQFNEEVASKLKSFGKKRLTVEEYVGGISAGDRAVLGKAITLIESSLPNDQALAQQVIAACLPRVTDSIRIGITGVPGVGKSTFIEALGGYLTGKGHKVAVLAVDPSSSRSGGSILGDKTRMETLANDPKAFIRPSSTGGTLGGVARKTRESIILCEAAGFDVIFVETVGVGQSEVTVHHMVDFFLLLMLPGAGDELQGIKRGIMEMADAIIIHKADGDNMNRARLAKAEYENALHLFPEGESGWLPKVLLCSSFEKSGIGETWQMICDYRQLTKQNGFFSQRRNSQSLQVLDENLEELLRNIFFSRDEVKSMKKQLEKDILQNNISPYEASRRLIEKYLNTLRPDKS